MLLTVSALTLSHSLQARAEGGAGGIAGNAGGAGGNVAEAGQDGSSGLGGVGGAAGTIASKDGGNGVDGNFNPGPGSGGSGGGGGGYYGELIHGGISNWINSGVVQGGSGGAGGAAGDNHGSGAYGGAGGGGAGGHGAKATSLGLAEILGGEIRGGHGGNGGSALNVAGSYLYGGHGGDGGIGLLLESVGITSNRGDIVGGNGGVGAAGARDGDGGAGIDQTGGSLTNYGSGSIFGGDGATGGAGIVADSVLIRNYGSIIGGTSREAGVPGGAAIMGQNLRVHNRGRLEAGENLGGGGRGDAVRFTGGVNEFHLHSGAIGVGQVVAYSAADTLVLDGVFDSTFDASLIGADYVGFGVFKKADSANWTLTGTGNQDWVISNGTLTGDSNSLQGNVDFTTAVVGSRVVFDQSFDGTYAGQITGTNGGMVKTGSGALTLTGAHSFGDGADITGGKLIVNGSIASWAEVYGGGALGGDGTLGGVSMQGGTVAPGNSIGTLNVTGNVNFSGGGVYEVEVNSAGAADRINAGGTATLSGGSVQVLAENGTYGPSTTYTILSAGGGLGGTEFDGVTSNLAFLEPSLSYDTNQVYLTLISNQRDFEDEAETSNQDAVADTLDALKKDPRLGGLVHRMTGLSGAGARQAFNALAGMPHTHGPTFFNRAGLAFYEQIENRLNGDRTRTNSGTLAMASDGTDSWSHSLAEAVQAAETGLDRNKAVWVRGYGGFGDVSGTANAEGTDYRYGGVSAGADLQVLPSLTLGGAGSYTRTLASSSGDTHVDSYQLAAYGRWQAGSLYLDGVAGGGLHRIEADRNVTVGATQETAQADYGALDLSSDLEVGYGLGLGDGVSVTPFAGVRYGWLHRDGFTETGAGLANLRVEDDREHSLSSRLGGRVAYQQDLGEGMFVQGRLEAAWVHDYLDRAGQINAAFSAAPDSGFLINGPDRSRDRARLGAGVTLGLTADTALDLSYQGDVASDETSHAVAATIRWAF
ncbi:hypothetical protein GCM10007924_25170 [Sneathiella chinensis]|uniref:Autotransporter domain-containing protein n=1 Tax=Sneathiella chinensis TaxID=349750 RepID=A0ABQ5U7A3_9PROT|nr:hypothetical protein GCM10007924_25170 [Sneathiella chinensis]